MSRKSWALASFPDLRASLRKGKPGSPPSPPAGLPLSHMQASVSTTRNTTNKTVHEAWDAGAIIIMTASSVLDGVRGALLNPRPCHVLRERQLVAAQSMHRKTKILQSTNPGMCNPQLKNSTKKNSHVPSNVQPARTTLTAVLSNVQLAQKNRSFLAKPNRTYFIV